MRERITRAADLRDHEAPKGIGHAIERHVGQTDEELADRSYRDRRYYDTPFGRAVVYAPEIGTFDSIENANTFVADALRANAATVDLVARGDIKFAIVNDRPGGMTGREVYFPTAESSPVFRPTFNVRVVLAHVNGGFAIRTAFPFNPDPSN